MRRLAVIRLSAALGKLLNRPREPPCHGALTSAGMKLLLVEDDASMQAALQRALGRRGMDITVCGDGAQALARWKSTAPDVVLLDLTLPGLDGLQVLEQARKGGLTTPVHILTARGTVGDRIIGLNTGADDYLAKPFDLVEQEARLRALHRRSDSEVLALLRRKADTHPMLAAVEEAVEEIFESMRQRVARLVGGM